MCRPGTFTWCESAAGTRRTGADARGARPRPRGPRCGSCGHGRLPRVPGPSPSPGPSLRAALPVLAVLVASTGLASLGTLSRFAYADGMTPFAFTFWRALVGGALLLLVIAVQWQAGPDRGPPRPR